LSATSPTTLPSAALQQSATDAEQAAARAEEAAQSAEQSLAALVKAWPATPDCLKDALRGRLTAELDRMVGWGCFCGDRAAAQAAVRKSAKVLKGLPDVGGADLADRWLQTAGSSDTRFNCRPS